MANMYNINGLSYTAKENPEWFTRAMYGGRLIEGGYVRALMGIKGDELLSMIDLQNKILQIDGKDCGWTPNQIIKLSEKKASVTTYKINLEQCIDELENKRTLYQMSPGAQNDSLPPELEAATMYLIAIGLSNEIEELIVAGDKSQNPNEFDGMQTILLNSTQAAKMVGGEITKTNVLDVFEAVYQNLSESVLQSEDAGTLFFFTSYGTRRTLITALADKNNQNIINNWEVDKTDIKNPKIYYLGVEVVPAKKMAKNTIICIDNSNAYLLTDLLSDLDEIKMGQFAEPKESKVWIKGRMRLGFIIPFEDEAVIWSDKITTAQEAGPGNDDLTVVPNSLVFSAVGDTQTFNILTLPGVTPELGGSPTGFTVTQGTTSTVNGISITPVTVVASNNEGSRDVRVGEIDVKLPDSDRGCTVTLNQRNEDVTNVTP
jgi:hypothetical protein